MDGWSGPKCEESTKQSTRIQQALKVNVTDDYYEVSGLYYKAQDNCHGDFIAKDFFSWIPSNDSCLKETIEGQ